jgi:hypothetical protein
LLYHLRRWKPLRLQLPPLPLPPLLLPQQRPQLLLHVLLPGQRMA